MITISEKDGATIIVIENPSGTEKALIQKAKQALNSNEKAAGFWAKHNKERGVPVKETPVPENQKTDSEDWNLDDFEEIYNPNNPNNDPPF